MIPDKTYIPHIPAFVYLMCFSQSKPQGGTLIFSYIRRLRPYLGVQSFEFQYFLGFQKGKYFFGYEDFVDIFLGSSQN